MVSKHDLEYPSSVLWDFLLKHQRQWGKKNEDYLTLREAAEILDEEDMNFKGQKKHCIETGSKYDLELPIWILVNDTFNQGKYGYDFKQELDEAIEILKYANREHERKRQEIRERVWKSCNTERKF